MIWCRMFSAAAVPASAIISTPMRCSRTFEGAGQFSRKIWGLLSLELWQQQFHDRAAHYRRMAAEDIRLSQMEIAAGQ